MTIIYTFLIGKSKRRKFSSKNCNKKDISKIEKIALEIGLNKINLYLTKAQHLGGVSGNPINPKGDRNILFQTNTKNYQDFEKEIYANKYYTINSRQDGI